MASAWFSGSQPGGSALRTSGSVYVPIRPQPMTAARSRGVMVRASLPALLCPSKHPGARASGARVERLVGGDEVPIRRLEADEALGRQRVPRDEVEQEGAVALHREAHFVGHRIDLRGLPGGDESELAVVKELRCDRVERRGPLCPARKA